jgi:hypothetical protein
MQLAPRRLKTSGMILKHATRSDYSDFLGHDIILSSIIWE